MTNTSTAIGNIVAISRVQIGQLEVDFMGDRPEHDLLIHPQHVDDPEHHPGDGEHPVYRIALKAPTRIIISPTKPFVPGNPDRTKGSDHEKDGKYGHDLRQTAKIVH